MFNVCAHLFMDTVIYNALHTPFLSYVVFNLGKLTDSFTNKELMDSQLQKFDLFCQMLAFLQFSKPCFFSQNVFFSSSTNHVLEFHVTERYVRNTR